MIWPKYMYTNFLGFGIAKSYLSSNKSMQIPYYYKILEIDKSYNNSWIILELQI